MLAPDRSAATITRAIIGRLGRFRHRVHTITLNNGKEFAEHPVIATALRTRFYFAAPYSAWQRGSNENANGLTRQYLPRETDFSTITCEQLRWIEERLYNLPRKTLGFRTPLEVFSEESINTVADQS